MSQSDPTPTSLAATIVVFVLVTVAIVGGGVLLLATQPDPVSITIYPPEPTATPLPSPTPGPLTVYVTGAVNQPETLVTVPAGSRVQDAIEAAGGALDNADLVRVNLAGLLRDGDQVYVPFVDEITAEPEAGITDTDETVSTELALPTPMGGAVVNVNIATVEELMTLPRIGEVTAVRIIEYREENGPFADLEALGEVSGIGPATLEALADLVVFE